MKNPQEYVDLMQEFIETRHKAVKIDKATKEDAACLTMVASLKELPVEVLNRKGIVALRRLDASED